MDYAMLSRYSIQSTSDQDDYKKYCTIAANSPTALCPEQSAIWAYPITSGDREEVVFNMINAMLLRIHQSGHLGNIDPERKALVKESYQRLQEDKGGHKGSSAVLELGSVQIFGRLGISRSEKRQQGLPCRVEERGQERHLRFAYRLPQGC